MRTSTFVALITVSCLSVVGSVIYVDYQNSETSVSNDLSTLESFAVSEHNKELAKSLDGQNCCPEDEHLEDSQLRVSLIEKHGDISEINEFFTLVDKVRHHIPLTPDDSLEFHRLLALFFPSPKNTEAYETAQWFHKLPRVEGSYSMVYRDE